VELELEPYVTSPFVRIGFYDKKEKEFIELYKKWQNERKHT
jgi:hypothetical protein